MMFNRPVGGIVLSTVIVISRLFSAESNSADLPQAHNTRPPFRVNVNLINVPITVLDEKGRPIVGLCLNDFRLFEDDVEQDLQHLIINQQAVDAVLLLDISRSVHHELSRIRKAAMHFAKALGRPSRFSVVTFSDEVEVARDWTSSLRAVDKALQRISYGLRTSMYDGICLAAEDRLKDHDGKKAIIMLTDGIDNESHFSFQQAAEAAIRSQASVYVIGLTNIVQPEIEKIPRIQFVARALQNLGEKDSIKKFFDEKRRELEDLSRLTGGRAFFPLGFQELHEAYGQVADELKSKAFLTYVSKNQDTNHPYRKIKVVCRREDATVLFRAGYYIRAK
ncbi:MAG: VWA domain-containing protein [Acidobacteria bacterium]|nr:VWA domain-containing protein [Acidobacteriota bacterium]MBI3658358.1 VWA domain-containing protein [Acidobacteriota bacterium]